MTCIYNIMEGVKCGDKFSVDVVVCTKDRPQLLEGCVDRLSELIPFNRLYIFEGSDHSNYTVLDMLEDNFCAEIIKVPSSMKFGAVRNLAIKTSTADFVAMIDDDIVLAENWFQTLMKCFRDNSVVAVCGKLIYEHYLLGKLSHSNTRNSGGSGGASIYDRQKVLDVGNFDPNVHRGEDMELELRIVASGQKWVKSTETEALHPMDVPSFLSRAKTNVVGWDFIMRNSSHKTAFITKRFASTFVMPVYYFWKTFDLRCAGLWSIYKWQCIIYWLSGKYVK